LRGEQKVKFATSPLMSTYLVAFIVSDFKSINATTSRGVFLGTLRHRVRVLNLSCGCVHGSSLRGCAGTLCRVWTPPDKISQADVALESVSLSSNQMCYAPTGNICWFGCGAPCDAATQAVKILTYYEDLYQLPFPLPKQDLVAVPDFSVSCTFLCAVAAVLSFCFRRSRAYFWRLTSFLWCWFVLAGRRHGELVISQINFAALCSGFSIIVGCVFVVGA
jgi:hypothetical protein